MKQYKQVHKSKTAMAEAMIIRFLKKAPYKYDLLLGDFDQSMFEAVKTLVREFM